MSTPDDLPPLDEDLAGLLGELRDEPPPREAMNRVRMRVDATLGLPPRPPSGGEPNPPPPAAPSPASVASTAASTGTLVKVALVAFALGGAAGVGVTRWTTPEPRIQIVHDIVQIRAPEADPSTAATPLETADASVRTDLARDAGTALRDAGVSRVDAGVEVAEGRDRVLADENALVTRAQSALARGRAGEALEALAEHQRRFPGGQFVEEREAMTIQALVRVGRLDAARARAERFRARFPGSMLLRAVEAAVGPPP